MTKECTEVFIHYREIARLLWNLGFWPNPELREWDCIALYEEAISRLFEGMVLRSFRNRSAIENRAYPGSALNFGVKVTAGNAEFLVNKNPPGDPARIWGSPTLKLNPDRQELRFMSFFDWDQRAPREMRLLEVRIERMDDHPELVGRHGLIELDKCSISLVECESPMSSIEPEET